MYLEIVLKRLKPFFALVDLVGFVTFELEGTAWPFVAWPLVPFCPDFAALPFLFAILYSMQLVKYVDPILEGLLSGNQ